MYLPTRSSTKTVEPKVELQDKMVDPPRVGWFADSASKYKQSNSEPFGKDSSEVEEEIIQAIEEDDHSAQIVYVLLAGLLVVLVVLIVVIWTINVTTQHRSAVDDLMEQLTNSTDTALKASLVASQSMVQAATNIWQFTGKLISHTLLAAYTLRYTFDCSGASAAVDTTSAWAPELLQGYYQSARVGALRFATTAGLEQTTNVTYVNNTVFTGLRVLSREFYNATNGEQSLAEADHSQPRDW